VSDWLDERRVRARVETLSRLVRSSARSGERESAAQVAAWARGDGAPEVAVEPYRYQHSYALAHGLHNAAGLLACALPGRLGEIGAATVLVSYEREVSGRSQWLRRRLPASEGANVLVRVRPAGPRRGCVLLVAHHDAANTGFIWNPRLVAAAGGRHLRRHAVDPFMAPLEAALALRALRSGSRARRLAAALLATGLAADISIARGATVPGASDNATGVAACLELLAAFGAAPLNCTELLVAFPGCEEAGMGGMRALLDAHAPQLGTHSFVLGLDTLGAGTPIVCAAEGSMRPQRYRDGDLETVEAAAREAGLPVPQRWRIGGWTDPVLALHRGLHAASLLSIGPGYFPGYHHATDVASNVDYTSVAACTRIAHAAVVALDRRYAAG
jgi:hypothetical protein